MSYKTPKRHTMDYKKDIKGNMLVSQAPSSVATTFGVTLSKKCERLATAVYLVTNFLSDSEPLKSRLRSLSVDFVRDASFVRYGGQATETSVLDALRANIGETLSLLELALIAGLVSEMNFTILKREYATLRDSIDIKKASRESRTDSILGDNFFGTPEPARPHPKGQTFESADPCLGHKRNPSPRPDLSGSAPASSLRGGTTKQSSTRPHSPFPIPHSTQNPKGHSIGQTNITMSDRNAPAPFLKPNTSNLKPPQPPTPRPHSPFPIQHSVQIESRRTRILKLIKDNREVAIKDIVAYFPDVSEKTIQRELVYLSDSGVLKKTGERRWSRYSLA